MASAAVATTAPAASLVTEAKAESTHIIAPARIKTHLNTFSINRVPRLRIKEIKQVLGPIDNARSLLEHGEPVKNEKGEPVRNEKSEQTYRKLSVEERKPHLDLILKHEKDEPGLREELAALQHSLYRFGTQSFNILEPVIRNMLQQLVEVGFDNTSSVKRHIIRTEHFHEVDKISGAKRAESMLLFPLISNLGNWRTPKSQFLRVDPADDAVEVTEPELTNDKSSFKGYIRELLKILKRQEKYANLRMSDSAKDYLDALVVEFLRNFSQTLLELLHTKGTKTVSAELIQTALHIHIRDDTCYDEKLVYREEYVVAPETLEANNKLDEKHRKPVDQLPKNHKVLTIERVHLASARRSFLDSIVTPMMPKRNDVPLSSKVVNEKVFTKPVPKVDKVQKPAPVAPVAAAPVVKAPRVVRKKAPAATPAATPAPVPTPAPAAIPTPAPVATAIPEAAAPKQKRVARPKK